MTESIERNIVALKGVRERILEERCSMESYICPAPYDDEWDNNLLNLVYNIVTEETLNACGTRACFAGWAILNEALARGKSYNTVSRKRSDFRVGAALLGLDLETAEAAFMMDWPEPLDHRKVDHQLAMIDGLIAGWSYSDDDGWVDADGEAIVIE